MCSSFLPCLLCFAVGNFVWWCAVTTSFLRTLLHNERRCREKVVSLNDKALYMILRFGVGIFVLEQTSTIAIDVSSSHIFVAVFTLDLVREFYKKSSKPSTLP